MAKADGKDKEPEKKEGSIPTASSPGSGVGPGTQIDHFRIDCELGRGGAGVVYLARDTKLCRWVAIKILPPELVNNPQVLRRWKREARLLASLNHPNIATIHEELEEAEGTSYLVLEYVEGETLRDRIVRDGLTVEEAVSIALQIAEAMSAAHNKDVIHRDLKPSNIKITPEGRVKVLDFGIAKMFGGRKSDQQGTIVTEPGQVIGTPGYMSPEQSLGKEIDHRSDIWSFGCVLYEMLTTKRPFPGRDTSEVLESILRDQPDWKALPEEVGSPLREVICKCLEKNPEKRYLSGLELHQALLKYHSVISMTPTKAVDIRALLRLLRTPWFAIASVLFFVSILILLFWLINRRVKIRWARNEAMPEIMRLVEQDKYFYAFVLAQEAENYLQGDPVLLKLHSEISELRSIVTAAPGADIFFREYSAMGGEWKYLGRSPLENIRIPRGLHRWRISKEGYETRECVAGVWPNSVNKLKFDLWGKDSSPGNMARILAGTTRIWSASLDSEENVQLPEYWIDKYEVTNRQFRKFVDTGGYSKREYWKHKFIKEGYELSWEQAMKEFHDGTGRNGPSTWEGGTCPEGHEEYPVSGICWYEAVAYGEFVGKSLPTIHHWSKAANINRALAITPWSNFGGEGPMRVGSCLGIGKTGLYDMAGNVREWCWNTPTDSNEYRFVMGGSWIEPSYIFTHRDAASLWDRSPVNGFRCVSYLEEAGPVPKALFEPSRIGPQIDFSKVKPASQETVKAWIEDLYSYDRTELNAVLEEVDENSDYWRRERVTFDAAYGGERVVAYLFLPKRVEPPFQAVVYWPGWGATWRSKQDFDPGSYFWDFIIKSGRAFLYPIYKGTHERRYTEGNFDFGIQSLAYRDWHIQMSKDLRRSIDYLGTRDDIRADKLAYYGFSWGARLGPLMLALEERIKVAVLVGGGFGKRYEFHAAMHGPNFAPHVKCPVMMVNGREDTFFPLETSQKPMYEALGTPREHKKHILYPGTHGLWWLFSRQMKKDVLNWLDRYLGPVE